MVNFLHVVRDKLVVRAPGTALAVQNDWDDFPEPVNPPAPTVQIDPTNIVGGSLDVPIVKNELAIVKEGADFYRDREARYRVIATKAAEMAAQAGAAAKGYEDLHSKLSGYIPSV